jgi:RimJ/RimL family protein N-acetyltransferase
MATSRVLETPRLLLEPFSRQHSSDQYVNWMNDPDVVRFSEQRHRRHTRASVAAYANSFEGTPHYFWAIVARDQNLGHVGNISATVDVPNAVADVGILIGAKAVWGRGFGTEAWREVCRFLIADCGLRKVTGGTVSCNEGMLAIMRHVGMREDGVRRRHLMIEGREEDVVHMAMFSTERSSE